MRVYTLFVDDCQYGGLDFSTRFQKLSKQIVRTKTEKIMSESNDARLTERSGQSRRRKFNTLRAKTKQKKNK